MQRKLTITVDEEVYQGLHTVIGRRKISRFLNDLAKPHVANTDLAAEYRAMAANLQRERDALEWAEALIADGDDGR